MIPPTIVSRLSAPAPLLREGVLGNGEATASSQRALIALANLIESVDQVESIAAFPDEVREIVLSLYQERESNPLSLAELRTVAEKLMALRDKIDERLISQIDRQPEISWEATRATFADALESIAFWSIHFEGLADQIDPIRINLPSQITPLMLDGTKADVALLERLREATPGTPTASMEESLLNLESETRLLLGQSKRHSLESAMMDSLLQVGELVATATTTDGKSTANFNLMSAFKLELSTYERPLALKFYLQWTGSSTYTPTVRADLSAPKYVIQELFKVDRKDLCDVALALISESYKEEFRRLACPELGQLRSRRERLDALGTLWNGIIKGELIPVANFDEGRKFRFEFLPPVEAAKATKKPILYQDSTHPLKRARETMAQTSLSKAQLQLLSRLKRELLANKTALPFSTIETEFVAPNRDSAASIRTTLFNNHISPSLVQIYLSEDRPEKDRREFAATQLAKLNLLPTCEVSHRLVTTVFDSRHQAEIDSILKLSGTPNSHSTRPEGRERALALVMKLSRGTLPEGLKALNDPGSTIAAYELASSEVPPSELSSRAILTRTRNPRTLSEVSEIIDYLTTKEISNDIETYALLELAISGASHTWEHNNPHYQRIRDQDQERALLALLVANSPLAKSIQKYLIEGKELSRQFNLRAYRALANGITIEPQDPRFAKAAFDMVRRFHSLSAEERRQGLKQVGYNQLALSIAEQFARGRDEFTDVVASIILDLSKTTKYNEFRNLVIKALERPLDHSPLVPYFVRWLAPNDTEFGNSLKRDLYILLKPHKEKNTAISAAIDGAEDLLKR